MFHPAPRSRPPKLRGLRRLLLAGATSITLATAGLAGVAVLAATPAFAATATGGNGASLPYTEVLAQNSADHRHGHRPELHPGPARRRGGRPQGRHPRGQRLGPVRHLHHPGGDQLDRLPVQHPGQLGRVGLHRAAVAVHQRRQADRLHPDQRVQLVLRQLPVRQHAGQRQPDALLRRGAPAVHHHLSGRHDVQAARSTRRTPRPRTRSTSPTSRTSPRRWPSPRGSVSVVSEGADPTGVNDSTERVQRGDHRGRRRRHGLDSAGHVQHPRPHHRQQRHR